jgi:Flp pilus assembly pilin Flp
MIFFKISIICSSLVKCRSGFRSVRDRGAIAYHAFNFKKSRNSREFLTDESGAVTVDLVVLTAGLVIIGGLIITTVQGGISDVSNAISDNLSTAASDLRANSPMNPLSYAQFVAKTGNDFLAELSLEEYVSLITLQENLVTIPREGGEITLSGDVTQDLPDLTGWGNNYAYTSDPILVGDSTVVATVGVSSGGDYEVGSFNPTDYDEDIIWADGYFVRWPEGTTR